MAIPWRETIDIVHRADDHLVVDKPAGLLAVPGRAPEHADCVAARVRQLFAEADGPLTVHRLDMETSGLMLVALDRTSQRALSRQFEERTVVKRYVAIVQGQPAADQGNISLPLRPDLDHRPRQIVDHTLGRDALTHWRVLERGDGWARLEFVPHTGRTHQLRVHAAAPAGTRGGGLGCPIRGDTLYGDPSNAPRLMLHATVLQYDDPTTGARVRVQSPAPF